MYLVNCCEMQREMWRTRNRQIHGQLVPLRVAVPEFCREHIRLLHRHNAARLSKTEKKRRKRKQRNPHCRNPDTKKLATPFGTRQLHSSHQIRDSKTPSRRVNIPYDRIQCVWLGLFQNLHPSNSKYFRHSACLYRHNKYVSIPSSS